MLLLSYSKMGEVFRKILGKQSIISNLLLFEDLLKHSIATQSASPPATLFIATLK
jgi:hypothetical protein